MDQRPPRQQDRLALAVFGAALALLAGLPLYVFFFKVRESVAPARARETLWYVPKLLQMVKVVREGRTPDEGSSRIVAELLEFR